MPVCLIPFLVAIIATIITIGVGILVVLTVFGEVDFEDVKLLILLSALCFGLPAIICFIFLV